MRDNLKISIEFSDLDELRNVQVDICKVMQCALSTKVSDGLTDGFYVLGILEEMCNKGYEVATEEIARLKTLKISA